jgi:hypothetical protein
MNLLDAVYHRDFLDKIFPRGLTESFMIGQIEIDPFGMSSIKIHTQQRPAIEVKKWGVWGERYNTIVIVLSSSGVKELSVKDVSHASYAPSALSKVENNYRLTQYSSVWSVEMVFEYLTFDRCEVYMDDGE